MGAYEIANLALSPATRYIATLTLARGHPLGHNGKWHLAACHHGTDNTI